MADEDINEDGMDGFMSSSMESLVEVKESIKKFNTKHGEGFRRWWQGLAIASRVKFIRDVYPTIVESPKDRWCLDGGRTGSEGKKTYQEIYLQYVLLMPEFCVEYLSTGNNLPELFNTWTANESSIVTEMNSRVVKFRQLYRRNAYPWPEPAMEYISRYLRETKLQKGDIVYILNNIKSLSSGNIFVTDDKLSVNQVKVQDPEGLLKGTGQNKVGGYAVNLYDMGSIVHPFEYDTICEVFAVFLYCLAALIDEYKEDELGSSGSSSVGKSLFFCVQCTSKENIKKCQQCLAVYYCSKDCQTAHWPTHKAFCRLFKSNHTDTTTTSTTTTTKKKNKMT